MARRIEWQQISTQGLNPQSAMGTSVNALQGAAATAQSLRANERANELAIQNSYSDLIKSHLNLGALKASTASKTPAFNPAVAEQAFYRHFESGGTPATFQDNPELMGFISQTGESGFDFGIKAFDRYQKDVETQIAKLTAQAEAVRDRKRAELARIAPDETVRNRLDADIENEFRDTVLGIQEEVPYIVTSLVRARSRLLGTEPETESVVPVAGITPAGSGEAARPESKANEFNNYMRSVQQEGLAAVEDLERMRAEGEINEAQYEERLNEINRDYQQTAKGIETDRRKYSMVSADGNTYKLNHSVLPDGSIRVGNRTLTPEVGNAFVTAAEAFDVPVEVLLAFSKFESSFNPGAVSNSGVEGLMQVQRTTGQEMLRNNSEIFTNYGVTDVNNRKDPLVSAMTGAAYIAHIRDDIFHGAAPMEQIYVAYNLGPNDPLVRQFHNSNVPIDKLPGVNVNKESIQNNKDVYFDKQRNAWRTPAEISAFIRERMELEMDSPDPVARLEQVATGSNQPSEEEQVEDIPVIDRYAEEYSNASAAAANNLITEDDHRILEESRINLNANPIGELRRVNDIANSVIPLESLGGDGSKLGVQLSREDFEGILTTIGVKPDPKRIAILHDIVTKHPELSTMPSEDVAVLLSFAPAGMWGSMDEASTLRNVDNMLELWNQQADKIRAQMTAAHTLKKDAEKFQKIWDSTEDDIRRLTHAISRMDSRPMSDSELKVRNETLNLLREKENELQVATAMYENLLTENMEKILRFRTELKSYYDSRFSREAEDRIRELEEKAKNKDKNKEKIIDQYLNPYWGRKTWSPPDVVKKFLSN